MFMDCIMKSKSEYVKFPKMNSYNRYHCVISDFPSKTMRAQARRCGTAERNRRGGLWPASTSKVVMLTI